MKKVLFLTPELPYPPLSGGKLKSWKMVENLSQHYELSVATILKENDADYLSEFILKANLDKLYIDPVHVPRTLGNLIKSYFKGIPLNVYRTFSSYFKKRIQQEIDQFEMVICDHYEVFQYIPDNYPGKVILHQHNAYHLLWLRYAQSSNNQLSKRLVAYFEAQRVKTYEKKACIRADLIFASPNDIAALSAIGVEKQKFRYTYHLGDDTQLQQAELHFEDTRNELLYVGSLNWEANIDGLLWFIQTVWPALVELENKEQASFPSLTIIGKNPDKRLLNAAKAWPNIFFPGFVADLEPYFKKSRVFIAPLQYGAGMKVKVLNAMCRGIPTVTTAIGAEGLEFDDMKQLAIANTSDEMVAKISLLLRDKNLWTQMQKASRQLIMEKYTWKQLFNHMNSEIEWLFKQTESKNLATKNKNKQTNEKTDSRHWNLA